MYFCELRIFSLAACFARFFSGVRQFPLDFAPFARDNGQIKDRSLKAYVTGQRVGSEKTIKLKFTR